MTPAVSGGGTDRLRLELRTIVATTFRSAAASSHDNGTESQMFGPQSQDERASLL
jgi:hypothetical protein